MSAIRNSLLLIVGLLVFAACEKATPNEDDVTTGEGKSIVIYFSHPVPESVDATSGASMVYKDNKLYGSVQYMAEVIQKETDIDILDFALSDAEMLAIKGLDKEARFFNMDYKQAEQFMLNWKIED